MIERAVEILNEQKHEMPGNWEPNSFIGGIPQPYWYLRGPFVSGQDQYENFSHFEAIAIAEKYEREVSPASPATCDSE